MNGSGRERGGGKGEAATTRTAERVLGTPSRRVLGGEVSLESKLKLDDGGSGVLDDEGTGEVGDGVSESDSDGGGHFEGD